MLKTLAGNIFFKGLLEGESVVGKRAQPALTGRPNLRALHKQWTEALRATTHRHLQEGG